MWVSARCDYACKALLELALHWPNKAPLQIQVISKKQGIPLKYLVQILIQLKNAGLVASIRGKEGGYNLTKPPERISLGELIRQIEGSLLPRSDSAVKRQTVFAPIWAEVEYVIAKVLDEITFEDITNKIRGMKGSVVYQI